MVRTGRSRAVILLVIMILAATAILAACNSGSSNTAGSGGQAGETPNTQTAESSGPSNKSPREITFMVNDAKVPYAMEAKADDPYIQKLSELSGYKLSYEFIDENTYGEQLNLRYASGELPDVIFTSSIQSVPDALTSGALLELGDLIDQYGPNLKKNISEEAWKSVQASYDGKIYGIPSLSAFPSKVVVFYRQDWLEKLGMQPPVTIDDYLAFFEAVKTHDLNGNGQNDEVPLAQRENLYSINVFSGAMGAYPGVWRYRDNQLIPDIITPQMKELVKFWKTLYDKGYVNQDMFTTKSADFFNRIQTGVNAMWVHNAENIPTQWSPEFFVNQPETKIGILGGPVDSSGKRALAPRGSGIMNVYVIPAETKNPEDIIKFFDWAWSAPEAEEFFAYGIEGVNYTKNNGNIEWDAAAPVNADKMASIFYQLNINPKGDGRGAPLVLKKTQGGDRVLEAVELAKSSTFTNDGLSMPPIEVLSTHPELGSGEGSMFLDMFAKVVTGAEDADTAFDTFVAEWKRRGGDEAIAEATEWYNKSK